LLGSAARIDEDTDHDRDFTAVDQIVHYILSAEIVVFVLEGLAILIIRAAGTDLSYCAGT
jgi:hypothetical protein